MPQISSGYSFGLGINVGSLINLPAIDAVSRASGAKMRQAAAIFHAAEQQG